MNVKVKMPRLAGLKSKSSVAKELLMSVVATTISIILTFGTAHVIEERHRKAEGRNIAMMVIHDIDMYAETFRKTAEEDAHNSDAALYVLQHIDSIETLPYDTIMTVMDYIVFERGSEYQFDESIEKTFQSNQEIWRTIDAPLFIDEARSFFHSRRLFFQMLNTSVRFRRPVDNEELRQRFVAMQMKGATPDIYADLKEKLQDGDVRLFIQLSEQRQSVYNSAADKFQDMSNRCKFIMNISDDELETFLAKRKKVGKPLTDKKLIGRWTTLDKEPQTYEFGDDHKFTQVIEQLYPSAFYHGQLRFVSTYTGTWHIKGDSLYRHYDAGCDFKVDSSGITYSPEMRDKVKEVMKQVNEMGEQRKRQQYPDVVRAAAIDKSGNKIELIFPENDNDGRVTYLVRTD